MEISAKVLREVEFSGSLRGYNTDEVDEFLEQVAVGIDRLQAESRLAAERSESDRAGRDRAGMEDEESIRRTLVLAQRTADLAIKEAQEQAAVLVDQARTEAELVVGEARQHAERLAADAEQELQNEVARLSSLRDTLRTEIDTLVSVLDAERERLTASLSTALRYVERTLRPSAEAVADPGPAGLLLTTAADDGPAAQDMDAAGEEEDSSHEGALEMPDAPAAEHTGVADEAAFDTEPDAGEQGESHDAKAEVDDPEANIGRDPGGAAPVARQVSGQYDWESVARARSGVQPAQEDLDPARARSGVQPAKDARELDAVGLTAAPSLDDASGVSRWRPGRRRPDWPA